MRAVAGIFILCGLVMSIMPGCARQTAPRVFERQIRMEELAAEIAPVENAYRLEVSEKTQGRFACSLAIAKLSPGAESGRLNLVTMTPAEEAWWGRAVHGLMQFRDLQYLTPFSVVPEESRTDTLCAAAREREAALLLIYTPNRFGPNSAQVLGVLYDTQSCCPIAALQTSAHFNNEAGEEFDPDLLKEDQRDRDAYYQASRAYEKQFVSCIAELIENDAPAPTTQPNRWQTPPSRRWWVPRSK